MMKGLSAAVMSGAVGGAILLGAAAGAATASTQTKNQTTVAATCTDGFSGNALIRRADPTAANPIPKRWFVLHLAGTKNAKVLVPQTADVTFAFTDSQGNVTTTAENISKKASPGTPTTCSITGSKTIDGGSLAVSGSVTGVFR